MVVFLVGKVVKRVEKLNIAIEQLEDALKLYFAGRFFSAIVLASAAEELFAVYVKKHDQITSWEHSRSVLTTIANGLIEHYGFSDGKYKTEKNIGISMNYARNNSKHAGKKNLSIEINPQLEAQQIVERAISNFDALFMYLEYELPDLPLITRFLEESTSKASFQK